MDEHIEKLYQEHGDASGIVSYYMKNKDKITKQSTLTIKEEALLEIVKYLTNFRPDKLHLITYEYWKEYACKLECDRRLQCVLNRMGNPEHNMKECVEIETRLV